MKNKPTTNDILDLYNKSVKEANESKYLRKGQCFMNNLQDEYNGIYKGIHATKWDCFYNCDVLPKTMKRILEKYTKD